MRPVCGHLRLQLAERIIRECGEFNPKVQRTVSGHNPGATTISHNRKAITAHPMLIGQQLRDGE